jgi:hypothetical protein
MNQRSLLGRTPCQAFDRLLNFFCGGKLASVRFLQTFLDLLNLPPFHIVQFTRFILRGCHLYAAPNRTDTSFETPGSCMVTP